MRTVTFSDEATAKAVNESFVSTWVNRKPGFHNCDQRAEQGIAGRACFATKNFCTFFVTPDERVLHYFSGFFHPAMFAEELAFVQTLAKECYDEKWKFRKDGSKRYVELHQEHAKAHEKEVKPVETGDRASGQVPKTWGPEAFKHQGLTYLAKVHASLAEKPTTKLDDVFTTYLFGNAFTEE